MMMNQKLAKIVFRGVEALRGEPVFEVLEELEKSQWYSFDKIRELQWHKLKRIISHAYQNVLHYRAKFKKVGVHPSDIRDFDDMNKIPILTKDEFRENVKKMVSKNHSRRMGKAKTSGSTGIPLIFYKDRLTSAYHRAPIFRGHRWYDLDVGAREARLWGIPVNPRERAFTRFTDYLLNRFREREYNLTEDVLFDFYDQIKRKRPDYLKGYSSMVYQFALFLKNNNLPAQDLRLRIIKYTSESMYDHQKEVIEEVFNCKSVSEFGCAETGIISFECPYGKHHLMADCNYVEFQSIDNDDEEPRYKEVIVTDLHNYSLPIIRYRLEDSVIPSGGRCICGRGLPLIERIRGRSSDIVYGTNGRTFHSIIFYYIMKGLLAKSGGIKQFRVYQKTSSRILFQIVRDKDFDATTLRYITAKAREYLGKNMAIDYEFLPNIPRERSGKLRDFISELRK